jgi:hypothetical protein
MTAPMDGVSTCGIEASGWDVNEEFFVELSELQWISGGGQRLTLHRALRVGAIIFLRLVHATALGPAFPVSYQVRTVRASNFVGTWELDLAELHRREMCLQNEEPHLVTDGNKELMEQSK